MVQPPRRNWWSRNWKWAVPVGCLGSLILCGGGFGLFFMVIYGAVTGTIKSSDAYQEAMGRMRAHPEVRAALGEPIEPGWWISGNIELNGPSGTVDVAIPVSGPRGSGTLYVAGTRSAGQWQYSTMAVEIAGRPSRVNLLARAP